METDNHSQNQNGSQRPMLKKVKRPINRMPQQPANFHAGNGAPGHSFPATKNDPFTAKASQTPDGANPFISQNNSEDAFNLDAYLDDANSQPQSNTPAPRFEQDAPRRFLGEEDLPSQMEEAYDSASAENLPLPASDLPPYLTKKILILLGAVLFFMGIITTKVFFGEERIVRNGLQGVVVNPEVPKGRARCGVAERTQGCILYLMNPQRQEMAARDFYDLAAQLTGRQRFVIETGNMRYSNTKIRPGDIAQFNIPPM